MPGVDRYQTRTSPRSISAHNPQYRMRTAWYPHMTWPHFGKNFDYIQPTHHFQFPATSIHNLEEKFKSHVDFIEHLAQPSLPISSLAAWTPDVDIRETKLAYHIEIEVPGVLEKKTVLIQWLSPRTLLFQGEIRRPDIAGKAAVGDLEWEQEEDGRQAKEQQEVSRPRRTHTKGVPAVCDGEDPSLPWEALDLAWYELTHAQDIDNSVNGAELKRMPSRESQTSEATWDVPSFLLSERKIGHWRRTFTLPLDVDTKALRARLECGLLCVDLPKRDMTGEPKMKIEIE